MVGNLCPSWQHRSVAYDIIDFSLVDRSLTDARIFIMHLVSVNVVVRQNLHIEMQSRLIFKYSQGLIVALHNISLAREPGRQRPMASVQNAIV
jgi:hypothetical protein